MGGCVGGADVVPPQAVTTSDADTDEEGTDPRCLAKSHWMVPDPISDCPGVRVATDQMKYGIRDRDRRAKRNVCPRGDCWAPKRATFSEYRQKSRDSDWGLSLASVWATRRLHTPVLLEAVLRKFLTVGLLTVISLYAAPKAEATDVNLTMTGIGLNNALGRSLHRALHSPGQCGRPVPGNLRRLRVGYLHWRVLDGSSLHLRGPLGLEPGGKPGKVRRHGRQHPEIRRGRLAGDADAESDAEHLHRQA